ncbi:LPS export ABC transporter permease LptG [Candidatus Schneideria nysicola]|uniref:LPS export ABC transporter permease LptG n=1 Tax=Candidatus Schneideria nysicola TaxID=1081631 RepID=UPI00248BE57E|nr:LPS export ABC transporter permease LptG [Candidatus Schneideria nysicola]
MLKILEIYIGKMILNVTLIILTILISLSAIVKFIDQIRKVGQGEYSVGGAIFYVFLTIPRDVSIFFPMAMLLGVLIGLALLEYHKELMVIQLLGFSVLQIVYAVIKITMLMVLLIMIVNEYISPICDQKARIYRSYMIYNRSSSPTIFSIQKNGLWIKDSNNFIFIERILGKNLLSGVNIYYIGPTGKLKFIYASMASFFKEDWTLFQGKEIDFREENQVNIKHFQNSTWKTHLTPNKLHLLALGPDSLSFIDLYKYTRYLKKIGQYSNYYEFHMWKKILYPISIIVMILTTLNFLSRYQYLFRSISARIFIGFSFGMLFYLLEHIIGPLMLLKNISPLLGALTTSILFIIINLCIYYRNFLHHHF